MDLYNRVCHVAYEKICEMPPRAKLAAAVVLAGTSMSIANPNETFTSLYWRTQVAVGLAQIGTHVAGRKRNENPYKPKNLL